MSHFESLVYWLMTLPLLPVIVLLSLLGVVVGLFFVFKPATCIEMQKRFYARINWRMEPISLEKEIRNTRVMGWLLMVLSFTTLLLVIMKPAFPSLLP
jgi:hypothetical protein